MRSRRIQLVAAATDAQLETKFDKAGGEISGDVVIDGDLTMTGAAGFEGTVVAGSIVSPSATVGDPSLALVVAGVDAVMKLTTSDDTPYPDQPSAWGVAPNPPAQPTPSDVLYLLNANDSEESGYVGIYFRHRLDGVAWGRIALQGRFFGAPQHAFVFNMRGPSGATTREAFRIENNGAIRVFGHMRRPVPVVITVAAYTVSVADTWLICQGTGTITLTLPSAAAFPGRDLVIKNEASFPVNSNAPNVIPMAGGPAANAILAAAPGTSLTIVSNGTSWVAMAIS